ncbi:MAG: riboflavin biosynthesis protein RibF [Planctomycetota bacterium]|nr:riboflavin biosynthesis protein RibF [Planctomycetota bacterium]
MATALSIGMFDGVHLGHQGIIDQGRQAVGPGGRVVVMTFEPSPVAVLAPNQVLPRLMTSEQRTRALVDAGVNEVQVLVPTKEFLQQSPGAFLDQIVAAHTPQHIVEGEDFRFGCNREGDVAFLREFGRERGFEVHVPEEIMGSLVDGTSVPARSSVIRKLLAKGRVRDAACLLGRPWQLEGEVVRGNQRGRDLGCPTANLDIGNLMTPAAGVYAGQAHLDSGQTYIAAISVGTNPTFQDKGTSCEVHLLSFDGDLDHYGWRLKVNLNHWVREQLVFDSVEDLAEAMARDLERVQLLMSG